MAWMLLIPVASPAQTVDDPIFEDGFEDVPGSLVLLMPYQAPAQPSSADLDVVFRPPALDMYVILDRSGSMAVEITAVKNNLATVVNNLGCPPAGGGDPATCLPDLWAGAGTVGYTSSGSAAFQNWVDLQPNPSFASVPTNSRRGPLSRSR
jgi:hypothetical protein